MATSETLHRINNLVKSPRLKFAAALGAELLGLRYTIIRLDPVNACNLRCGMCFFSNDRWRAENAKGRLTKEDLERIAAELFPQALQVHFGASMEPTMFKDYPWLVELATRHRVPFIGFTTNGQLLTEQGIRRLADAGLDEITISTHGTEKVTYEALMPGASFEQHHQVLSMLSKVREAGGKPRLRLNFTVNPDNLRQVKDLIRVYGRYNPDTIQIRPVFDFGGTSYRNTDLSRDLAAYREAVTGVIAESKDRRIRILANTKDPTHQQQNISAYIYRTAFLRQVSSTNVWKNDFSWRLESLDEYSHRIHWKRRLFRHVLRPYPEKLPPSQAAATQVY
ncbi:radical SAM protein [Rhizobium sp. ARZ01]|uniref:radical SAM protein n=1 Tax=Rhizobium sp. ARZ01 TaxID=2769313 RepID=UPI002484CB72|nr:radical SAM protein [Rhizobium sp. ARZ01]